MHVRLHPEAWSGLTSSILLKCSLPPSLIRLPLTLRRNVKCLAHSGSEACPNLVNTGLSAHWGSLPSRCRAQCITLLLAKFHTRLQDGDDQVFEEMFQLRLFGDAVQTRKTQQCAVLPWLVLIMILPVEFYCTGKLFTHFKGSTEDATICAKSFSCAHSYLKNSGRILITYCTTEMTTG